MNYIHHSMIINGKKIDYYLFSAKRNQNSQMNLEIYDQSYFLWKTNWHHYFNIEHNDQKTIYSNDFTDHDECLSLFYQGECIANCLFKNFQTKDPTSRDDRYFSVWNDFFLQSIFKKNDSIKICTYFSVKEEFKKNNFDISIKHLLFTSLIKAFLNSSAPIMLGSLRTNRSMGKMGTNYGGRVIESNKVHHLHADKKEELVDLVLFEREEAYRQYVASDFYHHLESPVVPDKIKKAA